MIIIDKRKVFLAVILAGASALLMDAPAAHADSIITNILSASKSVVQIKSESAGLLRGPSRSVLDPKTGVIYHQNAVKGVQYTRTGAGVIIEPQGIIVTNAHTVKGADRILITLYDKTVLEATLLGVTPKRDLAFLLIRPNRPLDALPFANSDELRLHSKVYSVGNSVYLKNTLTEGRVSGLGRDRNAKKTNAPLEIIRVNFQVYYGDSGSPLLDERGRLLGITAAGQRSGNFDTFVIPSNAILRSLLRYVHSLKTKGPNPSA